MSAVLENKIVEIGYILHDNESQEILDKNTKEQPLAFLVGGKNIIPGLEKELLDLKIGDTKVVIVEPKEAYGEYDTQALEEVPVDQFSGIDLAEGMTLYARDEQGKSIPAIVKAIGSENVTVDYNHPLSGKTLKFDVEIFDIKDASSEEIEMGYPAPQGGGCCGGGDTSGGCCSAEPMEEESKPSDDACCSTQNATGCGCN